jgi:hypothetical protein
LNAAYSDSVPWRKYSKPWRSARPGDSGNTGSNRIHDTDDLVPWHQRQVRQRQLSVHNMQVGPAHGTGFDTQPKVPGPGWGSGRDSSRSA